jgi:hypothetical protein
MNALKIYKSWWSILKYVYKHIQIDKWVCTYVQGGLLKNWVEKLILFHILGYRLPSDRCMISGGVRYVTNITIPEKLISDTTISDSETKRVTERILVTRVNERRH